MKVHANICDRILEKRPTVIAGLVKIPQKRHLLSSSIAYAKYEHFTNSTTLNSRPFAIIAFLMFEENAFPVHC